MKRTVWIIHGNTRMDFSAASLFGESKKLFISANPFRVRELYDEAFQTFAQEGSEDDWLCLVGGQIFNAVACMAFQEVFSKVNLLIFDAKHEKYVPRTINFKHRGGNLLDEINPKKENRGTHYTTS